MQKNVEENSQLSHRGKNGFLKPQSHGPFLPIHPSNTQNAFWVWRREGNDNQTMEERAQSLPTAWGSQNSMRLGEKWKSWVHNGLGMPSQAFTYPTSQKHTFQKWVTSQIRIWPPYLPHPKEITFSTNLEVTRHKRQKEVVEHSMGFTLDIWIFPNGSRLNNSPSLFLVKSCPRLFNVATHS